MSTGIIVTLIVLAVALVIVIAILAWAISTYNAFVRMRNNVEEAFSTMDVYMKKRYDLIPNLVETVKGYTKHEGETLEKVIKARNAAMTATDPSVKAEKEGELQGTLKTLFSLTESYPNLKADSQFKDLMSQLKSIEDEIASSRKYYNGCVKQYNTKREVFPSSIIANKKKFEKKPLFEVESKEERQNVKVQF